MHGGRVRRARRAVEDERLVERIRDGARAEPGDVRQPAGARGAAATRRAVGRRRVERLMREHGIQGVLGAAVPTTAGARPVLRERRQSSAGAHGDAARSGVGGRRDVPEGQRGVALPRHGDGSLLDGGCSAGR